MTSEGDGASRSRIDAPERRRSAAEGRWIALLLGVAVLFGALYVRYSLSAGINHDEVEHLHVGFRLTQGDVPYRDFYQNHWPAYWLLSEALVRMFPLSIWAVLAGRVVNLVLLVAVGWLGLRLVRQVPDAGPWAVPVYGVALVATAYQSDFHMARPDPLMTFLVTAGLCTLPARGPVGVRRALGIGALVGAGLAVSAKALPFALVVPLCLLLRRLLGRSGTRSLLAGGAAYGVGVALALAPTLAWVWWHGLAEAFWFDVFELNRALAKPWTRALGIHNLLLFVPALLGVVAWSLRSWRGTGRERNGWLVLLSWTLCGGLLALLARHHGLYNYQLLLVPVATGLTALVGLVRASTRGAAPRFLLAAGLLGYPLAEVGSDLVQVYDEEQLPQERFREILELAEPGDRTCVAFAPAHPVFCRSVARLSNDWDLFFPIRIRDPAQLERFRLLWTEGLESALRNPPDVLLRRGPLGYWEHAAERGLVAPERLRALDALRPLYAVREIGDFEFWIRRE